MRPKVTAIVVARQAESVLPATLAGLDEQTVAPTRLVLVHIDSDDATKSVMRAVNPDLLLTVDARASFGEAVAEAVAELDTLPEAADDDSWLWLLSADNVPEPDALEQLLDTAERNPSLEVTGPKIVRSDDPAVIVEFGESITGSGKTVRMCADALDQGQFEGLSDTLGVAAGGMLVRRSTWERLDGFDPGLPAVDDALDFCVRTLLSDGRVLLSPGARVESLGRHAPGTAVWGKRTRPLQRYRLRRQAELHRRLAWSTAPGFVMGWLLLLPIFLVRMFGHLLRKQPGRILPDLAATLTVMFGGTGAWGARRRRVALSDREVGELGRLFVTKADAQRIRATRRDEYRAMLQHGRDRFNFVTGGGIWLTLIGVIASGVLLFPLLRGSTIAGGALLPLSGSIGELWAHTGYGLRDTGGGIGVSDPFTMVLAVLGSLTFWQPSLIITVIWFLAIPLSLLGAWFAVARVTRNGWLRGVGAIAYAASPTLFVALAEGRLAAVLVHLALPWLFFAGFLAGRSWAGAAVCSLLAALICACSPMLIPAMLVIWIVSVVIAGRGWLRQLLVPLPTLALFLPLAVTQFNRGRPLAIFADPGVPTPSVPTQGWPLIAGFPQSDMGGWGTLLATFGVGDWDLALVVGVLMAPLIVLALLGVLVRGWRLGLAGVLVGVLGLATAVVGSNVALTVSAGQPIVLWLGPALSLMWVGLIAAALAGAASLGPIRVPVSGLAALGLLLLVAPIAPAQMFGTAAVTAGDGRTLPALVDAQGRAASQLGTLVITPVERNTVQVHLERGAGLTLDEMSTLRTTNPQLTPSDQELANLAVSFLSDGTTNPTAQLHELGIGFVLVAQPGSYGDPALWQRFTIALSTNEALQTAGDTTNFGSLFQVVNAADQPTNPALAEALGSNNLQNLFGRIMLLVQAAVLIFVALLALPTGGLASRARTERYRPLRWADLDVAIDERAVYGNLSDETIDIYAEEPDYLDNGEGGER